MDIFLWKQLLKNLVLPPTGPLVVAVVGLALWAGARWRGAGGSLRGVGLALCAAGVVLLWALSTPIVADSLMRSAERYPALDLGKPIEARAIVILGGGVRPGAPEYGGHPAPSSTTLQRLVYGARVARATGLPVLVSGSHFEAEAMNDFLRTDLSVTPRWVENHSRDTRQNAQMSAAILERAGIHNVVLVTSSEHMARAVTEFRIAGLAVVPAPAEMWTRRDHALLVWVPNAEALLRSQRALYEVLGRIVQSVRLELTAVAPATGRT
jgi:uncharacterized SAM-binding protein YcdF (DUF218 family)